MMAAGEETICKDAYRSDGDNLSEALDIETFVETVRDVCDEYQKRVCHKISLSEYILASSLQLCLCSLMCYII